MPFPDRSPDALAGGRYGLLVIQLDGDAVQDISWPGLRSSGGGLKIKEQIEGGRHSLPHRGHQAAEVASVLDKGFEDGAVHGN